MAAARLTVAAILLAGAAACDTAPVCARGEVRYQGRPPRQLFAYDATCRDDCFSLPLADPNRPCAPSCPDVDLLAGTGVLLADRTLWLADTESLGNNRALVFSFGFLDEALGDAPAGWGLQSAGPRTYLADEVESTARFVIQTSTVSFTREDDLFVVTELLGGPAEAEPGRLEITAAEANRIAGRFYLGYETATEQPESVVLGCFDLSLSDERGEADARYRVLGP